MNPAHDMVAQRAGFRCEYCRAPAALFNFPFEVEHVYPGSRGGSDNLGNLALSCRACNAFKGAAVRGTDPPTGSECDLFHPRRHRWEDHFQFDRDRAETIGTTQIGRATVVSLRLNHVGQVRARREWMRLDQYP